MDIPFQLSGGGRRQLVFVVEDPQQGETLRRSRGSCLGASLVALAILVDDRVAGALGAFPHAIDSLMMPVKLFRDEAEAMTRLREFLDSGGVRGADTFLRHPATIAPP